MKENRPCAFISRRVRRFIYYALFLALLSPAAAQSQDLNAWMYSERWTYWGLPQHYGYWVENQDSVPLAVVSVTLNFQPGYDWIYSPYGWGAYVIEGDTVTWVADDGYEIYPGQGLWFGVWGPSWSDAPIDYQIVGIWPGSDQGKATWGKTYGHAGY